MSLQASLDFPGSTLQASSGTWATGLFRAGSLSEVDPLPQMPPNWYPSNQGAMPAAAERSAAQQQAHARHQRHATTHPTHQRTPRHAHRATPAQVASELLYLPRQPPAGAVAPGAAAADPGAQSHQPGGANGRAAPSSGSPFEQLSRAAAAGQGQEASRQAQTGARRRGRQEKPRRPAPQPDGQASLLHGRMPLGPSRTAPTLPRRVHLLRAAGADAEDPIVARLSQPPEEAFPIGAAGADMFDDLLGRLDDDLFNGAVRGCPACPPARLPACPPGAGRCSSRLSPASEQRASS